MLRIKKHMLLFSMVMILLVSVSSVSAASAPAGRQPATSTRHRNIETILFSIVFMCIPPFFQTVFYALYSWCFPAQIRQPVPGTPHFFSVSRSLAAAKSQQETIYSRFVCIFEPVSFDFVSQPILRIPKSPKMRKNEYNHPCKLYHNRFCFSMVFMKLINKIHTNFLCRNWCCFSWDFHFPCEKEKHP